MTYYRYRCEWCDGEGKSFDPTLTDNVRTESPWRECTGCHGRGERHSIFGPEGKHDPRGKSGTGEYLGIYRP